MKEGEEKRQKANLIAYVVATRREMEPAKLFKQILLRQLTSNNARVINELTEIAKRNCKKYHLFVSIVEKHLREVPHLMMPLMYLIDSMCKNLHNC